AGSQGGIAGTVGEAVAAVVVGGGRVGKRAVRMQRQRAVDRAVHQLGRERVVVGVGVIGQHALIGGHGQRVVLGHGVCIRAGHGSVILCSQQHHVIHADGTASPAEAEQVKV